MISCMKLVSGEEIIGDIKENFEGETVKIEVTNPLLVVMMPDQARGQFTVALAPFLAYAKDTSFVLDKKHILTMFSPSVEMYNQYSQITGGVVLSQPNNRQLLLL